MEIFSYEPFGYEGNLVSVEVDLRKGVPAIDIVGIADGSVKERRERMKTAIRNSGFEFPSERVLISLSPADLKKESAAHDLAIALKVLSENENLDADGEPILVVGELEASGKMHKVRALIAALETAKANGITKAIVPSQNKGEYAEGMNIAYVKNLSEAFAILKNGFPKNEKPVKAEKSKSAQKSETAESITFSGCEAYAIYADIIGHQETVEALTVAAAGGHNILLYGEPGCGKTFLAQNFSSILPDLRKDEKESVNRIYSIAGLRDKEIKRPPFRSPHQTSSLEGMYGGGASCRPGEISLAHNGVLFLDEAAEFRTTVLQMLRIPLESGRITLSRLSRSTVFPADFQLVMAANPCPCGNYGSEKKICLCSARAVDLYWKKISMPLLDRVEIKIRVEKKGDEPCMSGDEIRGRVKAALEIQYARQGKKNAKLLPKEIGKLCCAKATEDAKTLLESKKLYARQESYAWRVARTIADIRNDETIQKSDMEQSLRYVCNSPCEF